MARIKLSEAKLRQVILNSVRGFISESLEDDYLNTEYMVSNPATYYADDTKEDQIDKSWKLKSDVYNIVKNRKVASPSTAGSAMSAVDPVYDKGYEDYYADTDMRQPLRKELDDKWASQKELDRISRMADRRPLHRKGSLNRAMMSKNESLRRKMDRIVAESVKKVLKESVSNIDAQQIYRALMSANGKYDEILQAMYTYAHLNDPGDLNDPHILSLAFEMMGRGYDCSEVPDEEYEQMKQELQKLANQLEYYGEFADE